MTRRYALLAASAIALAALRVGTPARAADMQPPALPVIADDQVCLQKIRSEERTHRIPRGLLAAIGFTESGRSVDDHRTVWPWTVNVEGQGYYFDSKEEAVKFVEGKLADGVESIDVGCMQINLKHHPDAFASLDDAFDPGTNVAYGADFLKSLRDQTSGWLAAARRYHSATPEKGQAYGELVLANWTGAAKEKELLADGAPADAVPTEQPAAVDLVSAKGFLRAQPVPAVALIADGKSLFAQFYTLPQQAAEPGTTKTGKQVAAGNSGSLFASTQRIIQRRVVPGQTGLTLKDYRAN